MSDRDEKGKFLPGNKFWEVRSSHGRNPTFGSTEDLWAAACEYFSWADENPLWEDRLVTFQGGATHEPLAKMRAMTISGLCLFLGISRQGWSEYCGKPDFSDITSQIEDVIKSQKFAGAAADLLNANIIARDLGLSEKSDVQHSGNISFQTIYESPPPGK